MSLSYTDDIYKYHTNAMLYTYHLKLTEEEET